jgi:hypothetical protein
MVSMGQVREQLSSLTVAQLEGGQISSAGGKVFVSSNALTAQHETDAITKTWRAVHAPSYGLPIPNSATSASGSGDGAIVTTASNQTVLINALSVTNSDIGSPAGVVIDIDGAIVANFEVLPTGTQTVVGFGGLPSLTLTYPQVLSITVNGVTPANLAHDVAYCLLIQG